MFSHLAEIKAIDYSLTQQWYIDLQKRFKLRLGFFVNQYAIVELEE